MALRVLIEEFEGGVWAAAVGADNRLDALEIDPASEEVRWGSIYWARVKTIDSALDAVFLDLDGTNTGILYNQDVRIRDKSGKIIKGGGKGIGKILKPGQFIAVQAKTAYIAAPQGSGGGSGGGAANRESKIPQMSMDITMAGRYLIFCAMEQKNRLSQRITDKNLRALIQKTLDRIRQKQAYIVRAAASNVQTEILAREAEILASAWKDVSLHLSGEEPRLIMLGPDAVQRILSDKAAQQIDRIEVVTMQHYNFVEEWCRLFAPDLTTKIEPQEIPNAADDLALFYHHDIMSQIETLFGSYAVLKGGGNIIIQETAALTAIDVNRGGDKGSTFAVNMTAAAEIARQMRLRNAGGIIMIDFIKGGTGAEARKLLAAMERAFADDPCTVQIHGRTALGLYEISRKRRTSSLMQRVRNVKF